MSFNPCPAATGSVTAFSVDATSFSLPAPRERLPRANPSTRTDIVQLVDGCERELRVVQSRLGTSAEQSDDPLRARELAHKAKNLRFAVQLWEQMMARRSLEPRPAA